MFSADQQQLLELLRSDWDLQFTGTVSEDDILKLLEQRILQVADKSPEAFFQLMYRLDVPEDKVRNVLFKPEAPMEIAKLVYKRQLQKVEARKWFKTDDSEADSDLKW